VDGMVITRHVSADPVGVALVLAGPGVDGTRSRAHRLLRAVAPGPVATAVLATPVRQDETFSVAVEVIRADAPAVRGRVTVTPSTAGGSDVRIALDPVTDDAEDLTRWLCRFADSLTERARSRAFAA